MNESHLRIVRRTGNSIGRTIDSYRGPIASTETSGAIVRGRETIIRPHRARIRFGARRRRSRALLLGFPIGSPRTRERANVLHGPIARDAGNSSGRTIDSYRG